MAWSLHVTVAAVIERDGQFLMVEERVDSRVVINQPAGHLDLGESLLAAVVRETLEETGWHFTPRALVGIYRWQHPESKETFLRTTFCGDLTSRDHECEIDPCIIRTVWMTHDELRANLERVRSPMVISCVEDYQADHRYPLSLLNDIV